MSQTRRRVELEPTCTHAGRVVPSSNCVQTSTKLLCQKWWCLNWDMNSSTRALCNVLTYGISSSYLNLPNKVKVILDMKHSVVAYCKKDQFEFNCIIIDGFTQVYFHLWHLMMSYSLGRRCLIIFSCKFSHPHGFKSILKVTEMFTSHTGPWTDLCKREIVSSA